MRCGQSGGFLSGIATKVFILATELRGFFEQPGHGFRTARSRIRMDLRITRIFFERPGHGFRTARSRIRMDLRITQIFITILSLLQISMEFEVSIFLVCWQLFICSWAAGCAGEATQCGSVSGSNAEP